MNGLRRLQKTSPGKIQKENFCIRQVSLEGIFYQCLQRTGAACYGSPPAPYAADLAGLTLGCQLRTDLLTFLKPVAYL